MEELKTKLNKLKLNDEIKIFPNTNPNANVFDIFRSYIATNLSKIIDIDDKIIYPAIQWTLSSEKGDVLIPLPRLRIDKSVNLDLKAKEWAEKFPKGDYIQKVVPQGKFLQFYFNPYTLSKLVLPDILTKQKLYGNNNVGNNKKVIIEFSSPNIAKPFHAGHLRSTIIGGFLSNLHEALGWNVTRMNYLGDWGKQFGLLAVGFKRYGSEEELEKDPVKHLFDVYVKINADITAEKESIENGNSIVPKGELSTDDQAREYFKKMEDGDKDAYKLWEHFRSLSIEKYKKTYARLNIFYDVYSGESQVPKDSIKEGLDILYKKNLLVEDKGAVLIDLTKYNKKLGKAIVTKKDGTTLYLTRDIGAAISRYEKYHFDKMIYVVACQQDLYLQQLYKILSVMDFPWAKDLSHISFGMVQGMSTRKGTVVFLDNILEEAKEAMHDVMKKNEKKYAQVENPDHIADLVGISAVMIQDMSAKRINNYTFNWSRILSFEGDTGPYLQYAHSRLNSVARNANIPTNDLLTADFSLLVEPAAIEVIRILAAYPDTLLQAYNNSEPSTVVTYLFRLAHAVSSAYNVLWVAGQEKELATARLALYSAARQVLSNAMILLGLTPVERM